MHKHGKAFKLQLRLLCKSTSFDRILLPSIVLHTCKGFKTAAQPVCIVQQEACHYLSLCLSGAMVQFVDSLFAPCQTSVLVYHAHVTRSVEV